MILAENCVLLMCFFAVCVLHLMFIVFISVCFNIVFIIARLGIISWLSWICMKIQNSAQRKCLLDGNWFLCSLFTIVLVGHREAWSSLKTHPSLVVLKQSYTYYQDLQLLTNFCLQLRGLD